MPLFTCANACQLTLDFKSPAVCPANQAPLLPYTPPSGQLVVNWNTGCKNKDAQDKFRRETFTLKRFVSKTHRGLFDCNLSLPGKRLDVVVKLFPVYTNINAKEIEQRSMMGPPEQRKAYAALTPWTELEKRSWEEEQQEAVAAVWDGHYRLRCVKPGWKPFHVTPRFRLEIVKSKSDAHIIADVLKTPPSTPDSFNCGGTYVGLDQIIQMNPQAVSKAALSSESGTPVKVNSGLMGYTVEGLVVFYNIIAHEYGHMLGLPDEYNSGDFSMSDKLADMAYALHASGTNQLAMMANLAWVWNTTSDSLMSKGSQLHPRHLITVWEALGAMTQPIVSPSHWQIV